MISNVSIDDLKIVYKAIESGDNNKLTLMHNKHNHILQEILLKHNSNISLADFETDTVGNSFLALTQAGDEFRPIKTLGDGNCLFNSISLLLSSSYSLAISLRILCAIELSKFDENNYLNILANLLSSTTASCDCDNDTHYYSIFGDDEIHSCFQNSRKEAQMLLALKTSTDRYWGGLLNIIAVANIVKINIKMFYPWFENRICYTLFEVLSMSITPMVGFRDKILHILWSSTSFPEDGQGCVLNHFVALEKVLSSHNNILPTCSQNSIQASQAEVNKKNICASKRAFEKV